MFSTSTVARFPIIELRSGWNCGRDERARNTRSKNWHRAAISQRKTLRSYEKGASLPQLVRLVDIGNVYDVTLFDILESTAEYIYRASGEPASNRASTSVDKIALYAVVLYCGVTPAQLRMMETHPRRRESISEGLFDE